MAVRIIGWPLFTVLHFYATPCIIIRMTDLKERRLRAIAELIRGQALSSQEQLAERLAALGFAATQATISRDLEQIGAVKVRRDGHLSYALRDEVRSGPNPRLAAVFRDWLRSVEPASNLVLNTTITCSTSSMLTAGLPLTMNRSAFFPGAIVPMRSARPR